METIYIFLLAAIVLIISIGLGLEISKTIEDMTIYVLFWFLYIITIITFINILLVFFYYYSMRNKTGPAGARGQQGERGDGGEVGKCDVDCRDKICENALMELLTDELKARNQDVAVKLNNVYIKSKIRQMCSSDEFRQLAPYNGPMNLINYLKTIWKMWIDMLYNSGGILYFETIGAEDEFEWQKSNPFDEMKKYDVFYWGMGKQYRPQIIDKCYPSDDGETPKPGFSGSILNVAKTNYFTPVTTSDSVNAFQKVSFWRGKQFTRKGAVYYPIGDIAIGPKRDGDTISASRYVGEFEVNNQIPGPTRETILVSGDVKGPINYELIWSNEGFISSSSTGATENNSPIYIWRPIAPNGYMALGDIVTTTESLPTTGEGAPIRCVPMEKVKKQTASPDVMWASQGSDVPVNLNVLGYVLNSNGASVKASETNSYNVFRGITGMQSQIPDSDVNGSFYYLDTNKYTPTTFTNKQAYPDLDVKSNNVGKGYIPSEQKDSKYSILAYLQLKNNPSLVHKKTNITLMGQLIPNAVSNVYTIKLGSKCVQYANDTVSLDICDDFKEDQHFSIIFTGNAKNECKIKHVSSGKMLAYTSGEFTLVTDSTTSEIYPYTLFVMN